MKFKSLIFPYHYLFIPQTGIKFGGIGSEKVQDFRARKSEDEVASSGRGCVFRLHFAAVVSNFCCLKSLSNLVALLSVAWISSYEINETSCFVAVTVHTPL